MSDSIHKWRDASLLITSLITTSYTAYTVYEKYYKNSSKYNDILEDPPKIKLGVDKLIGNTPMVRINSLSKSTSCQIYAKLELNNPAGSAKDRVALNIILTAEKNGQLTRGNPDWVFEGTSGSTGISIAMICNALGYRSHISLPDDTSIEKLSLLESLGAVVNKVKPASIVDPDQYVNAAKKACEKLNNDTTTNSKGIFADQFENEANWKVHFNSTGPEIYKQMNGKIDAFIAGCGTGGTITGVAKYLKEVKGLNNCHVVLADPQGSGFFNRINYGVMYDSLEKEGTRRRHQVDTIIEGIGLNRITRNFNHGEENIDESIRVTDDQAIKMAKFLSVNDGLFVGSSTAINAVAAIKLAKKLPKDSRIVIIACDSGSRHLSKFWKEARAIDRNITLKDILGN
ncbi:hypothetical protein TBLA_0E01230 [Henningerozyma blattae CBS 6284]|uniref:cysteine synthase n=1 Tax=Henningerozyma blattae (strain ATCC 34711 / CBS 6284 / DSM 70876 / NBRC 10599 / NRRL Y-10934 / UCD 77-7) TaxID=1071380 RepID=I2H481_HENB6|nr:hypothetical protein TBLA_0E01230 [Tetrapisispora blattae CBS 6284]CCH61183.1 hypothetical protein TBLA_0E01230 [Tetrapisispora blattae CBS 6284]